MFERIGNPDKLRTGSNDRNPSIRVSQLDATGSTKHQKELNPGHADKKEETIPTTFKQLWRGLELVLLHHRVPSGVLRDAKCQILRFLQTEVEEIFVKRAKYLLALYMAKYTKSDLPPPADIAYVATGQWKGWIDTRMKIHHRNTHLWYSWFQCKRCAGTLTEGMILLTYVKHRIAMEKQDPISLTMRERVMKQLMPMLTEIRGRLMKVYSVEEHFDESHDLKEAEHVASLRACFEAPRSERGQMGALLLLVNTAEEDQCFGNQGGYIPDGEEFQVSQPDRTQIQPMCLDKSVYPFAITTVKRYPAGEAIWADAIVRRARADLEKPSLRATIQAVLEPLKVRVISKGNAAPYYLAKYFQKKLHGILREYPFFRLIGKTVCPTDLFDLVNNKIMGGTGPFGFASIDFAAATDNLSASLSREIMEVLTCEFPDWWKDLFLKCLAPHFCKYPKVDGVKLEDVQQQNGQLMGSIVSFLILCLANAGVTLAATAEQDPNGWYDRLRGVLINGDDNGFVCRKSVYKTFTRYAEACGLEMSVGKAYWHPRVFNINSQCFHLDLAKADRFSVTPKVIPYLNTGLFFGQGKVLEKDGETCTRKMSSVINEVVQGSLPGKQCQILKQYLALHRDSILKECRGRNLFIPIELGGMGIQKPVGFETKVTYLQQVLAGSILNRNPYLDLGMGPRLGSDLAERPETDIAPWLALSATKIELDQYCIVRNVGYDYKVTFVPKDQAIPGLHFWRKGRWWKRIMTGHKIFDRVTKTEFAPLSKKKCFQRAFASTKKVRDSPGVLQKYNRVEEDFLSWFIQTSDSVYSVEELAIVAARHLPPCVVQHRDRDCTIDEDLSPWGRFGRSVTLDIEMDHEVDTLLAACKWISTPVE